MQPVIFRGLVISFRIICAVMFSMIGSRCCVQVKSWKMMKMPRQEGRRTVDGGMTKTTSKTMKARVQRIHQLLNQSWVCKKKQNKRIRSVGDWRVGGFGGSSPKDLLGNINRGKIGLKGDFSLENFVMFTCKRNYFILQRKTTSLPAGESEMWNVSMQLNE